MNHVEFERFSNHYVLKLAPGEEVMAMLCDFMEHQMIRGAYFVAFGAFERVRLEYFDMQAKEYRHNDIGQQVEVVSLLGNVARGEDGIIVHMHGIVADDQTRTYSGHLSEGIVRPTLEVFVTQLIGEIRRQKDPESGLELLNLQQAPSLAGAQPGLRS